MARVVGVWRHLDDGGRSGIGINDLELPEGCFARMPTGGLLSLVRCTVVYQSWARSEWWALGRTSGYQPGRAYGEVVGRRSIGGFSSEVVWVG